jgi:DNA-binding transcriptional regulator YiaG
MSSISIIMRVKGVDTMIDIKKRRKELGMTQIDLAKKLKVSLSSVRLWEVGVTTPTEENMAKLIEVLGVK